ncbi:hypothetical protein EG870_16060, partial [Enterococcus faecalis]
MCQGWPGPTAGKALIRFRRGDSEDIVFFPLLLQIPVFEGREAVVDNIVEIIQEHGMNRQRVTEAMLPMFGANTHALVDTLFDISAQWMRRMQRAPMSHQGVNYIDTSESEAHSDSEVSSPDEE